MNPPENLKIEQLRAEDIPAVLDTFAVWHKTQEQFEGYLAEQERGERTVFLAWLDEKIVGWLNVQREITYDLYPPEKFAQISELEVISENLFVQVGKLLINTCTKSTTQNDVFSLIIEIPLSPIDIPEKWIKLGFYPVVFHDVEQVLFIKTKDTEFIGSIADSYLPISEVKPIEVLRRTRHDIKRWVIAIEAWANLLTVTSALEDNVQQSAKRISKNTKRIELILQIQELYYQLFTKNQIF